MTRKLQTKRIFLISNMWPDSVSPGYGSFVKNVSEGLDVNGVVTSSKALIIGRPKGKWNKIKSYLNFYWSITKGFFGKYDLIYIHFPNQAIPLLSFLYRFRKPKIVVNYHGEDLLYNPTGYTGRFGRATEQFCNKNVDAVVVPSEYYKRIVLEKGIIGEDKIFVSPSGGISKEIFFPLAETEFESREEPKNRALKFCYIGRMEEEKGILTFLKILKNLRSRNFNFQCRIIGYGSQMDYTLDFIRKEGLENSVEVIPGVPQKELGDHYREMDLLIFPSENDAESLGLTGIESMACGTPVVGSNVGGIATYLKDGENGFLVSPGDAEQFADAIQRYSSLPLEERKAMRAHSIATGKKYYSDEVCAILADKMKQL